MINNSNIRFLCVLCVPARQRAGMLCGKSFLLLCKVQLIRYRFREATEDTDSRGEYPHALVLFLPLFPCPSVKSVADFSMFSGCGLAAPGSLCIFAVQHPLFAYSDLPLFFASPPDGWRACFASLRCNVLPFFVALALRNVRCAPLLTVAFAAISGRVRPAAAASR